MIREAADWLNAPGPRCWQLGKSTVEQSASPLQARAGFSNVGMARLPQNPQNTPGFCAPLIAERVMVAVVKAKRIGRTPRRPFSDGGQSWLVGWSSPEPRDPGSHAMPSLGPPLHFPVVGLQIGHG